MESKPHLLVICGRNKKRSRTAEHIFKNDPRFFIRSAGLSEQSNRKVSEKDMAWAHLVLVMEDGYAKHLKEKFSHLNIPPIQVLHIDDDYEYLDPELIEILKEKVNDIMG